MTRTTLCRRAQHGLAMLGIATAVVAAAAPRQALAECSEPPLGVAWSYPNSSQLVVPVGSVIWSVSFHEVRVELDGVELFPVGSSLVERAQYVPPTPLAAGEHELRWTFSEGINQLGQSSQTLRFRASPSAALPGTATPVADAFIEAVTEYPILGGPDGLRSPPPEEYDRCLIAPIGLSSACDDSGGGGYLSRLELVGEGQPLAYLTNNSLVDARCQVSWQSSADEYWVAAVLPTGLGPVNTYSEPVETRTVSLYQKERGCALPAGGSGRGQSLAAALLALLACGAAARRGSAARRSE
jgi:hypothetical protein